MCYRAVIEEIHCAHRWTVIEEILYLSLYGYAYDISIFFFSIRLFHKRLERITDGTHLYTVDLLSMHYFYIILCEFTIILKGLLNFRLS